MLGKEGFAMQKHRKFLLDDIDDHDIFKPKGRGINCLRRL
jgi:hypothetical protein